jgi:hypothetical protein
MMGGAHGDRSGSTGQQVCAGFTFLWLVPDRRFERVLVKRERE